jgi:MFS family permease
MAGGSGIPTDVPARLDRLPWSRFHTLVVTALGVTWLLDGLEVTIVGSIGPALQDKQSLGLSAENVGALASCYVGGAVVGAVLFGWLADRYGRRAVFYITLATYLVGVLASSCAWSFASLALCRILTGAGIGGEYAAINSAIDELVPARLRGRTALFVNGSYWIGAGIGAAASLLLLDAALFPATIGWRLGFGLGGVLGLFILFLRRFVPESPRWLIVHRRHDEARQVVGTIEESIAQHAGAPLPLPEGRTTIHPDRRASFLGVIRVMAGPYRARSLLVIGLMVAQAFLYNALFFTYGLVLTRYYQVAEDRIGLYILPLAVGNFLGPALLGRFFDTIGRRRMMAASFALSGILVALTAWLFVAGALSGAGQTLCWMVIFFFASAAASSVYLLASEIFPLEMRALAIALFYAFGTALGGIAAPWIFGRLIGAGTRGALGGGYLAAGVLMGLAALLVWKFGVDSENKSLEAIALPHPDDDGVGIVATDMTGV